MKHSTPLARLAPLFAVSVGSWAGVEARASAQEPERPVLVPAASLAKPGEVLGGVLDSPALARGVSLEAMRKPLAEAVAELAALGGVALKIDPAQAARLPQDCRVTMRVRALPLAKILASLSDLYGGQWRQSDGASFVWLPLETPLALQARRLGGLRPYPNRTENLAKQQRQADLAGQVLDAVGAERLDSPEGVALSEVPAGLRALLVKEKQESVAIDMAYGYTFFQRLMRTEPYLRLGRLAPDTPRLQTVAMGDVLRGGFGIYLMAEGNRAVTSLFDEPASSNPDAAAIGRVDEDAERVRKAAEERAQRLRDRIRNPNGP